MSVPHKLRNKVYAQKMRRGGKWEGGLLGFEKGKMGVGEARELAWGRWRRVGPNMTVWHLTDGKGSHSGVRRSQMPRDRREHEMGTVTGKQGGQVSGKEKRADRRGTGQVGTDRELLHTYNRHTYI